MAKKKAPEPEKRCRLTIDIPQRLYGRLYRDKGEAPGVTLARIIEARLDHSFEAAPRLESLMAATPG